MSYATLARKESDTSAAKTKAAKSSTSSGLRIGDPDDAYEREADRVAEAVLTDRPALSWSLSKVNLRKVQRQAAPMTPGNQPSPDPNNYKEAADKLAEAFLKTDIGKKLTDAAANDPLVKGAEDFVGTLPGKIIAGAAAAGAVSAMAATHTALPAQIPGIPLDKIRPGLSVKITYGGPVDRPTKAMITFSYTPKGEQKKPKQTESERYRAETARIAAEQEKFRTGMKYKPGSAEDLQQKAEQKMFEDWNLKRFGALPGTGGTPLVPTHPAPQGLRDTGLRLPTFQSPFQPKAPTVLDQKLELKPLSAAAPLPDAEKKKEEQIPVQRKAESAAVVQEDATGVDEVLRSPGRPLDDQTRRHMEAKIGFDFGKVRVHSEEPAAISAKYMGALAYTVGSHVAFGNGRYSPQTEEGRKLLAHELAHTVQQNRGAEVAGRSLSYGKSRRRQPDDELTQLGASANDSGTISVSEAASKLQREQDSRIGRARAIGPVRFRVPTTADLKKLFTSGNVPESVLKDRIEVALTRMAAEKRLKTSDAVPEIMKKIFPSAGVFDEKAYEDAVDVNDRSKVYQNLLDAETKVTSADQPKLKTVLGDSATLIDDCVADDTNLASVFGSKKDVAKANYPKAKTAIQNAAANIDTAITTDYNLDDPEIGLGGWATFSNQHVHFMQKVVKVTDEKLAKVTIIHEASHLSDPSVKDKGYYGSKGFEGRPDDEKVTNAAHYEEVPRRKLGKSIYQRADGTFIDFKPGMSSAGTAETFEDKVRRKVDEFFRMAWDKAVDVQEFIRDIRKEGLAGSTTTFNAKRVRILELSRLMHLTVHEQPAATASINQVDLILSEGVAHATANLRKIAKGQSVPNPVQLKVPPLSAGLKPPGHPSVLNQQLQLKPIPGLSTQPPLSALLPTEDQAADKVILDSIITGGALGNYTDDKKLMDWLVAEYKKPI